MCISVCVLYKKRQYLRSIDQSASESREKDLYLGQKRQKSCVSLNVRPNFTTDVFARSLMFTFILIRSRSSFYLYLWQQTRACVYNMF